MSSIQVVGIDVGGQHLVIAQAKRGGVDVILNEASKRLTPALVSFAGDERFLGEAATTQIRTNLANTITSLKNILGRKFSEEGVQEELATYANYTAVPMENDEIGIQVQYNDETRVFAAAQVMGMLLFKARQIITSNNPGLTSIDTVISVPSYYTSKQRAAMHEAATIARLNCMALINEGTAAALSYGIFRGAKKEFDDSKETLVAMTDMGYSKFTVTIAAFTNSSLKVLASASDSVIGGRHLDRLIAKRVADQFKEKTGLDAWSSARSRLKLLMAAEKVKTTLSPYGVNEAPISIECLVGDNDYNGKFTIEDLEEIAGEEYKNRIQTVVSNALANASKEGAYNLSSYKDFAAIELVGGSARPRLVKRAIAQAFGMPLDEAAGHGLNSTMNLDEAIARGCALASAKLSHVFKVREYHVHDSVVIPLAHSFSTLDDTVVMDEDAGGNAFDGKLKSFAPLGLETPFVRRVAVNTTSADPFRFRLFYDLSDEFAKVTIPKGTDPLILEYVIGPLPEDVLEGGKARVRVSVKCNESGVLSLANAEALKEIKEDPVKMEEDAAAPAGPAEGEAAKPTEGEAAPAPEGEAAAAPAPEAAQQAAKPVHKKYKKIPLEFKRTARPSLLQAWVEEEDKMAAQDASIRETQDCRNSLETYIYKVRGDMEDSLVPYTTSEEREKVTSKLWEEEDWVTGDGFESDKATFQKHLDELTALCQPFYVRKEEAEGRYSTVEKLQNTIGHFKTVLENSSGQWNHLLDTDFDALRSGINGAAQWLKDKQAEQSSRELYQEPAFTCAEVNAVTEQLIRDLRPIELKPVPKPVQPPAEEKNEVPPPAPDAPETQAGQEASESAEGQVPMEDESAPAGEDAASPMETEPETAA